MSKKSALEVRGHNLGCELFLISNLTQSDQESQHEKQCKNTLANLYPFYFVRFSTAATGMKWIKAKMEVSKYLI